MDQKKEDDIMVNYVVHEENNHIIYIGPRCGEILGMYVGNEMMISAKDNYDGKGIRHRKSRTEFGNVILQNFVNTKIKEGVSIDKIFNKGYPNLKSIFYTQYKDYIPDSYIKIFDAVINKYNNL